MSGFSLSRKDAAILRALKEFSGGATAPEIARDVGRMAVKDCVKKLDQLRAKGYLSSRFVNLQRVYEIRVHQVRDGTEIVLDE